MSKKLTAIGIGLIIAWIISEIFLGLCWNNYWGRAGRFIRLSEYIPNFIQIYSREGLYKGMTGKVAFRVDGDGFILPNLMEGSDMSAPHITIAFMGASTTKCLLVKEDLRFPVQTGKILKNRLGRDIFIINAACSGETMQDTINILFNKVVNYHPDIVVLLQGVNDAGVLINKGDYKEGIINERPNTWMEIVRILSTKSNLLGFLRNIRRQFLTNRQLIANKKNIPEYWKATGKMSKFKTEDLLLQFESRLKVFIDMCRDFGATPVLMTQPFRDVPYRELNEFETRTFLAGMKFLEPFNNEIRKVCAESGVFLIDLEKEVPKTDKYFYDEIHLTDEGSILISDIISRELINILD